MVSAQRLTPNGADRLRHTRLRRLRQAGYVVPITIFLSTLGLLVACSSQVSNEDIRQAQAAAQGWLGQVDAAEYAQSWDAAAGYFRDRIPQSQWVARVSAVRDPLGKLKRRQQSSLRFRRSLPGAPDGEYVIIQYDSSFEHKAAATETVTPMKDADGRWRVSGYYIK